MVVRPSWSFVRGSSVGLNLGSRQSPVVGGIERQSSRPLRSLLGDVRRPALQFVRLLCEAGEWAWKAADWRACSAGRKHSFEEGVLGMAHLALD